MSCTAWSDTAGLGREEGVVAPMVGLFTLGYMAIWAAFSLGATTLQRGLDARARLTPGTMTAGVAVTSVVLVAAGLYQWTPLKQACLQQCRAPLDFILHYWREGPRGAFAVGLGHGAYCLGCCWMLMLLLFVGGAMNLLWIAGLALFVLWRGWRQTATGSAAPPAPRWSPGAP
jgi:predicted metal-binding membrane protein